MGQSCIIGLFQTLHIMYNNLFLYVKENIMKTIYLHRNKFNNKVYIGQTIQTPEERWKKGKGYKNNPYFDAAI